MPDPEKALFYVDLAEDLARVVTEMDAPTAALLGNTMWTLAQAVKALAEDCEGGGGSPSPRPPT